MDYRALFEAIRDRTGMYLVPGSYLQVAAFVLGVDAGNAWCFLTGFREWLVVNRGASTNLGWEAQILEIAFPDGPRCWNADTLTDEQQKQAINLLVSLLLDFMAERDRHGGTEAIFTAYAKFIRERSEQWEREAGEEQEATDEQS